MKNMRKRLTVVTITLAVCALALSPLYVRRNRREWADRNLSGLPMTIGAWQGEDVGVDNATLDLLESNAVLVRKYTKEGRSVWLALVYYGDNRVALHLPENCSIGTGTDILDRQTVTVAITGKGNLLVNELVTGGRQQTNIILYYFQAGDLMTPSYAGMRWRMIKNFLKNRTSSGALIRCSIVVERGEEEALDTLKDFLGTAAPVVFSQLQ